jgi:hypothetical protein
MTKQGLGNYGAGLFHDERHGETVLEHPGGMEGFNTDVSYVPRRRITVIVLCNRDHSSKGLLTGQLLDTMLDTPVALGDEPSPPLSPVQLQGLAGSYLFPADAPDEPVELSTMSGTLRVRQGKRVGAAIYQGRSGDRLRFSIPDLGAEMQVDSGIQRHTMNFHWDEDASLTRAQ